MSSRQRHPPSALLACWSSQQRSLSGHLNPCPDGRAYPGEMDPATAARIHPGEGFTSTPISHCPGSSSSSSYTLLRCQSTLCPCNARGDTVPPHGGQIGRRMHPAAPELTRHPGTAQHTDLRRSFTWSVRSRARGQWPNAKPVSEN